MSARKSKGFRSFFRRFHTGAFSPYRLPEFWGFCFSISTDFNLHLGLIWICGLFAEHLRRMNMEYESILNIHIRNSNPKSIFFCSLHLFMHNCKLHPFLYACISVPTHIFEKNEANIVFRCQKSIVINKISRK